MNIVILENQPSSRRGGQELSLFDVCRGLAEKGHSITLLYTKSGNLLAEYSTFCQELIQVNHYRFNARHPLRSLRTLLPDLWTTSRHQIDVVYSNQYHDSFFGYTLSRVKHVPFVCHLRLPPPASLGWQWQLGMQGATRLIAVSEHTKQAWIRSGCAADVIDVVYNGIDEAIFSPVSSPLAARDQLNISKHDFVIGYVGRLDRHKGLETLIKGFAQVQEVTPGIQLAIAGKPHNDNAAYLDELKSLATRLNVNDNVTFLGHVDCPALVYQASDLVVLPSEWPEPFGRTIIEALSCGVPVLGSCVGGIPEILTGALSQGLFESAYPCSLAEKLQQYLSWRQQHPDLGKQCRDHVLNKFTLDDTLIGVEKCLLKAVND